jgi:hypothetical protein
MIFQIRTAVDILNVKIGEDGLILVKKERLNDGFECFPTEKLIEKKKGGVVGFFAKNRKDDRVDAGGWV